MAADSLRGLAELAEAEFMFQYSSNAPASVRAALDMTSARIGGGVALSMRLDPTNYWSKALGFGFDEPVSAELVGRVCDFYRERKTPQAVIQIAPELLPPDWDDIRASQRLTCSGHWVKLAGEAAAVPSAATNLRISPVTAEHAEQWAAVVVRGFGMPVEHLGPMLAASVTHPDFRPFAAWDGDEIVAGANLFLFGDVGALNAGSTLPTHRGRGAQSALIAARARAAADAGCRWVTAETGRPPAGSANASLDNLVRAGLRPRYDRANWLWRADAGGSPE